MMSLGEPLLLMRFNVGRGRKIEAVKRKRIKKGVALGACVRCSGVCDQGRKEKERNASIDLTYVCEVNR